MLGLDISDTSIDGKLTIIIDNATERLKNKLGGITPPEELSFIVLEVAITRFNRIGSEGLTRHAVEGEELSFTDDDLKPYADDIQAWLERQSENTRGKLRFI